MEILNNFENTSTSLYKVRTIGETLSDSFKYMRVHFRQIFLPMLIIVWPLNTFLTYLMTDHLRSVTVGAYTSGVGYWGTVSNVFVHSIGYFFFSVIVSFSMHGLVLCYIAITEEEKRSPTVNELLTRFGQKFFKALGGIFLCTLIIIIGFIFFVIPGIYLAVALSVFFPVLIIEKVNPFESLSVCFRLIKGRFWHTLGLGILMFFIVIMLAVLVQVPLSILSLTHLWTGTSSHGLYTTYNLIKDISNQLVSTLSGLFGLTVSCLWYYSLAEEKYGMQAQKSLDQLHITGNTGNEGDF